jgi:ABC-type lipoprotein release transport system permease subunit
MVKLDQRLKASTLIESLISMVLIVVCFSVAVMIYISVVDNDKQRIKLKATLMLNEQVLQIKKEKNYLDDEKTINNWIIKKTVEHYAETSNVYRLSIVVIDKEGKTIAIRNELISME